ncbi:MAG TPA: lectin-like protein [Phycisphaerales bacterium]|nr:lectin-like protein [Phycisphaerales bacterium]
MSARIRRPLVLAILALVTAGASAQTILRGPIQRPDGSSRYYVIQGTNWNQMRAFAVSMGGDLATVNDAAEQTFLATSVINTGEKCFIGLNDAAVEGTLVWADGSTSTYRNFLANNGNSANSDYTLINGGVGRWDIENATFTPFAVVEVSGPVRFPGENATLTQAIQNAAAGPGVLLLGPGTFTLPSPLLVDNRITIRGAGVGQTTLQSLVGSSATLGFEGDTTIEDLSLVQRSSGPMLIANAGQLNITIRRCSVTSPVGIDSGPLISLIASTLTFDSVEIFNIDAAADGFIGDSQARYINCVIRDVDVIARRQTAAISMSNTFVNCTITRVAGSLTSDPATTKFYSTAVLGETNIYTPAQLVNSVFASTNPGFVNPAANNFNLLPTSSLIDAGNTQGFMMFAPPDFIDFAGNPRGVDVAAVTNTGTGALGVDIGAYEFQGEVGCDDIDFNNNGVFPEDQDVIDFFTVLAGGDCPQ